METIKGSFAIVRPETPTEKILDVRINGGAERVFTTPYAPQDKFLVMDSRLFELTDAFTGEKWRLQPVPGTKKV